MALHDVRRVFVVQDRASGCFVDINMTFVTSLRGACRIDSAAIARETMNGAIYEDLLECPDGYDVISFYEAVDADD
jgi:hypothetical protein